VEILKSIREWSKIPIVVVSARGHEREKVEVLDLGADDYIVKPFGTSELLARIRTALRHSPQSMDPKRRAKRKRPLENLKLIMGNGQFPSPEKRFI
jgi:two-component system KDP operon response regulator KdpE